MRIQRQRIVALGLSLLASVLISLPYLVARDLASPHVFTGFLINPIDGFSYLAKMREGFLGSWTFTLPYAAEAGDGVLLYLYHLGLGHLAALLHAPIILMYHAARILNTVLMFFMAFRLYERLFRDPRWTWTAFILTLLGSGLGWVGLLLGMDGTDLTIPESIPLFSAYANAHFPLALAAVIGIALACLRTTENNLLAMFQGWFWGTVLVLVLPFSTLSIGAAVAIWLAYEIHLKRQAIGRNLRRLVMLPGIPGFAGFVLGTLPWLMYNAWVVLNHPVISGWTAQNQTPSPSLERYVFGYSPLLLFAIIAYIRSYPMQRRESRFLAIWLIVNALLLYAPISIQRRFNLGLFIPLVGMAVMGLAATLSPARLKLGALLAIVVTLPSLAILVGAGIFGVAEGRNELVFTQDEREAYRWLEENLPEGALVLAGPRAGNRIPAFAPGRVLYGHPFETPDADEMLAVVERFFNPDTGEPMRRDIIESYNIDFLYAGPEEEALGYSSGSVAGDVVFQNDSITILRVQGDE